MRAKSDEVLAGLRQHAVGQGNAIRPNDLAARLNLPPKTVSNALNSLALEGKNPQVRRERAYKTYWYRYWIET
jgi:Mn-dependent DtxR family transcriptional regulator